MNSHSLNKILKQSISGSVKLISYNPVGGGCINQCYRLQTTEGDYFIKSNLPGYVDMFKKELRGLSALAANCQLMIPRPIHTGEAEGASYLLLEYVASSGYSSDYWEALGTGLAAMHKVTASDYGWHEDNYIGKLPQSNKLHSDWLEFFKSERLQPQFNLACSSGLIPKKAAGSLERLFGNLDNHLLRESPAFIHGDLWSGNIMSGLQGQPCLLDPAVYFGHREIELAFTTLFGGFNASFYQAYNQSFALTAGYKERFDIYNLYPLLVHLNLFGQGYLASIESIADKYS
ncbi:MAG: fructosamine kinase [Cyclobacteriaceae bacterium]|nr:MAG: fructosamine kinase [Cyclobacteriaceae bacterium]